MRLFKNLRIFKNWTVHYRNRLRLSSDKGKRGVIELRSGPSLNFRYHTSDLATIRSVFVDDSYFPAGISIPEDATVLDVGGHIGSFTVLAGTRARRGRVYSFEPEPENFALLRENAQRNGLDPSRCYNCAVAGKEEEREFFAAANPVRTGSHSLFETGSGKSVKVRCTTLPGLLKREGLDRIDLLKLDCEGAEWEIFTSLSDDELSRIRQIVMEVHGGDRVSAFERLKKLGFAEVAHPKHNYAAFARR